MLLVAWVILADASFLILDNPPEFYFKGAKMATFGKTFHEIFC